MAQHVEYRDHIIYFAYPPIPVRTMDWAYYHKDYDGDGDNRHGHGPSIEACKALIDEWHEEQ